jgi:hypothetical protein
MGAFFKQEIENSLDNAVRSPYLKNNCQQQQQKPVKGHQRQGRSKKLPHQEDPKEMYN